MSQSALNTSFGTDIVPDAIDGSNYLKKIDYILNCTGMGNNSQLRMKVAGIGIYFDSQSLRTSTTDLGITFYFNKKKMPLNQWMAFSSSSRPLLEAAPMKKPGASFSGGAFSADAVLHVEYP